MKKLIDNFESDILAALEQPDELSVFTHYSGSAGAQHSFEVILSTESHRNGTQAQTGSGYYMYAHRKETANLVSKMPDNGSYNCSQPAAYMVYREYDRRNFYSGLADAAVFENLQPTELADEKLFEVLRRGLKDAAPGRAHFSGPDYTSWNETLVEDFLGATLYAGDRGAVRRIKRMRRAVGEVLVSAEYIDISGDARHLEQSILEMPYLTFSVQSDGIEHVYERSLTGSIEVKTRIADERIRYASLPSFAITCDDEGDPVAVSFDAKEVEALENEERKHGLYKPTSENVGFLNRYVSLLT